MPQKFNRGDLPRDHPLRRSGPEIDRKRTQNELDDIFGFSQNNLERDDVQVKRGGSHAVKVEPSGSLDDEEFDTFTERAKNSQKLGWNPADKSNYPRTNQFDTPSPFEAHQDRSTYAAKQDVKREATVTTDPEKYANNPDRYDFPFVDTTQDFKQRFGDKANPFKAVEEAAGDDDLLSL